MTNRFSELNTSANLKNSKRENIFTTKKANQQNQRVLTGKSLKELSKTPRQNNNYKSKPDNSKNRYNDRKTFSKPTFSKPTFPKKETFKVEEHEFPELIESKKQEIKKDICDYKEKINKIKQEKMMKFQKILPNGWSLLSIVTPNKTNDEISPYYNPIVALEILENRLTYREELNDILGDISPYWDMVYPDELDDLDYYDESDNYEDEEDEYVEDW